MGRAIPQRSFEQGEYGGLTGSLDLDRPVGQIRDPTGQPEDARLLDHEISEPDPLHPAFNSPCSAGSFAHIAILAEAWGEMPKRTGAMIYFLRGGAP